MNLKQFKFNPSQKKIAIMALCVFLAIFFVWIFIVQPVQKKIKGFKKELGDIDQQTKKIEGLLVKDRDIKETMALMETMLHHLQSKFPDKEEASLRIISDLARRGNCNIISIQPQSRAAFLDKNEKPIQVDGKTCQSMSVTITMKATYGDLIRYLEALQESTAAYMTVEKLAITKDSVTTQRLNINISINLYFLI